MAQHESLLSINATTALSRHICLNIVINQQSVVIKSLLLLKFQWSVVCWENNIYIYIYDDDNDVIYNVYYTYIDINTLDLIN